MPVKFLLLGLFAISSSNGVTVKLPTRDLLNERFNAEGYEPYTHSNIVTNLAEQERTCLGMNMQIRLELDAFKRHYDNDVVSFFTDLETPRMTRVILSDSPECIRKLEDLGLLKEK